MDPSGIAAFTAATVQSVEEEGTEANAVSVGGVWFVGLVETEDSDDEGPPSMVGSDEEEEDVLDIPTHLRDTSSYCATLAHKINHSFRPNCRFRDYDHPVYGHIRCVVSLSHLTSGTEISVHYNYCLDDCPQWYADFWSNENSSRG